MNDGDDPLDLLNDDGDGVVEMAILEEENEKLRKRDDRVRSGCCLFFLLLCSLLFAGWHISRLL